MKVRLTEKDRGTLSFLTCLICFSMVMLVGLLTGSLSGTAFFLSLFAGAFAGASSALAFFIWDQLP